MRFIKKSLYKLFFGTFLFVLPIITFAQGSGTGCPDDKFCNPIGSDTIEEFILKFLEGAIKIGIPIIALAVIYCGFLFVAASGNSEKLSKAKDALLYTIIGAGILLGALAISKLVAETVTGIAS